MQFSRDLREALASGRITVSFRLWQRPQVKVAGRYAVGSARIEIDAMEMMPFRAVTAEDVRRSGERDRESLRARAAHAGPIGEDTLLYRVEFHLVNDARPDQHVPGVTPRSTVTGRPSTTAGRAV
ncbi:MAG: hypothetical protein M3O28_07005 [Actinomycetota bacterium]|nr:hypothetical protein [Actinomycetota bacterium]